VASTCHSHESGNPEEKASKKKELREEVEDFKIIHTEAIKIYFFYNKNCVSPEYSNA
jgi:hypothetical protein